LKKIGYENMGVIGSLSINSSSGGSNQEENYKADLCIL